MGAPPPTAFEEYLAEFFGETAPGDARAPTRDHVSFQAAEPTMRPLEAAEDFVRQIRTRNEARGHLSRDTRIRARADRSYSGAVTVRVAWQGRRFHTIRFSEADGGWLLASHKVDGGRDLSLILHEWLTTSQRVSRACWRTADEWKRGDPGRSAPT
jgi:hypothetical protein